MTGASGQLFGIKALEVLADLDCETHLVMSDASKVNVEHEEDYSVSEVQSLADRVYDNANVGAPPASGSFRTEGAILTPCSMKTLSNVAHGNTGDLVTRSADVTLKERRPLVVMPREKPFNRIHLKNMLEVTDAGGIVVPPFPSFYQSPDSLEESVTRTVVRALSFLDLPVELDEWDGL